MEDSIAGGFDEGTGYTPAIQLALEEAQLWCLLGIGLDGNGDTTYSLTGGFPLADELTGVITEAVITTMNCDTIRRSTRLSFWLTG